MGPIGKQNHQTPISMTNIDNILIIRLGMIFILDKIKHNGPLINTVKNNSPTIIAKLAISYH